MSVTSGVVAATGMCRILEHVTGRVDQDSIHLVLAAWLHLQPSSVTSTVKLNVVVRTVMFVVFIHAYGLVWLARCLLSSSVSQHCVWLPVLLAGV